uniref:Nucleotide exchange factor Fes1 domain-containing protein n=1 Tax=Timspurckia oligopyrenoides TaxID=708627 RepID=A0A7S0ZF68_9RHOD|mmetsp:Transcript_2915/g.5116  ORF Transcript_2915/g.5116 Transcript_2915/m.5116 type:complete len:329 (+) Transcript_2915:83-1069(+)
MSANSQGGQQQLRALNEILKWSTKLTQVDPTESTASCSLSESELLQKREQMKQNMEILNSLFIDEYKYIEELRQTLISSSASTEDKVSALTTVEEFMQDRNYSINIHKTKLLEILVDFAADSTQDTRIRELSLWALASAVQDEPQVKSIVVQEGNGLELFVKCLSDAEHQIRNKAVLGVSALLKNSGNEYTDQFVRHGGVKKLVQCADDPDERVAGKVLFFMSIALVTQCKWVLECAVDEGLVGVLVDQVRVCSKNGAEELSVGNMESRVRVLKAVASFESGRAALKRESAIERLLELVQMLEAEQHDQELVDEIHAIVKGLQMVLKH